MLLHVTNVQGLPIAHIIRARYQFIHTPCKATPLGALF
jgi:hypothetical protein